MLVTLSYRFHNKVIIAKLSSYMLKLNSCCIKERLNKFLYTKYYAKSLCNFWIRRGR